MSQNLINLYKSAILYASRQVKGLFIMAEKISNQKEGRYLAPHIPDFLMGVTAGDIRTMVDEAHLHGNNANGHVGSTTPIGEVVVGADSLFEDL